MRQIIFIALEVALFYILIGHVIIRKILPRARQTRIAAREFEHHLRKLIRHDRDLMTPDVCKTLTETWKNLRALRKDRSITPDVLQAAINDADKAFADNAPLRVRQKHTVTEYFEVLTVALAFAFTLRGFAMQPFKIPTGSMQPTLYGFEFVEKKQLEPPNPFIRSLSFLHYSRRYVKAEVKKAGNLESVREIRKFVFLQSVEVTIAGIKYTLPGSVSVLASELDRTHSDLAQLFRDMSDQGRRSVYFQGDGPYFNKGAVLAKGWLEAGDHVFVDRFSWNFKEPERGDITVFTTDGITHNNAALRGRYYIKRLVGMPGDELRIGDNGKLYLRPSGQEEFEVVDAEIDPAFEAIYSMQKGYNGYTHQPNSRHLNNRNDTFEVPPNHYFMLGDNSSHSLDSRFWGAVPRENLVGPAALIWWPYSERWGTIGVPQ